MDGEGFLLLLSAMWQLGAFPVLSILSPSIHHQRLVQSPGPLSHLVAALAPAFLWNRPRQVEPGRYEIAGHPTHSLAVQNEDVLDYLTRFDSHGLLLTLNIPRQGLVAPEAFTSQILSSLALKGLSLPSPPQPLAPTDTVQLHKQTFCLLTPTRRETVFKFSTHPTVNTNNFGIEEFRWLNKKVPNPLPAHGTPSPLIFICPRYGNILGPIAHTSFVNQDRPATGRELLHPCFGLRVLHDLPCSSRRARPDTECYFDVCPDVAPGTQCFGSQDDARPVTPSPPTPTPAVSLIRPRPSPPSIDRRVRQRQDELQSRQQTPLPAISPLAAVFPRPVTPPCLLLPPQFTILTRTDVGPLKPGPNLARAHDIYVWQLTPRGTKDKKFPYLGGGEGSPPRLEKKLQTGGIETGFATRVRRPNRGVRHRKTYLEKNERCRVMLRTRNFFWKESVKWWQHTGLSKSDRYLPVVWESSDHVLKWEFPFLGGGGEGSRISLKKKLRGVVHEANLFVNFDMHARSIESGANGLWLFLLHFEQRCTIDEPFILPDGILECLAMENKAGFFRNQRTIRVGVRQYHDGTHGEVSIGPGPERAIYRQAIATAVQDRRFRAPAGSGGFFLPVFSFANFVVRERCEIFPPMAHCSHCIATPWARVLFRCCWPLDPEAFDILAPWMTLKVSDPLPTDLMHPLVQFLMTVMETQPGDIGNNRTEDFHNACTIMFMCKVLLGSTSFWNHPEFLALKRGFDITIKGTSVVRVCHHPDAAALFRLLATRYLSGVGHPVQLRAGVLEEGEWQKEAGNPLLRVALLLQAATDTDLRPIAQTWSIKFRFSASNSGINVGDVDAEPRALHFHTCSYDIDVNLTGAMEDLLGTQNTNSESRKAKIPPARSIGLGIRQGLPYGVNNALSMWRHVEKGSQHVSCSTAPRLTCFICLAPVLDDSEESDSIDTPITRDLALGFEAAAHDRSTRNYVAMHEDVIEIDESPSPELLSVQPDIGEEGFRSLVLPSRSLSSSPDIDDVDDNEGSVQMRAVKIIEGILQLRSLETWPSPSSLADPAIDTSSSPMSVPVGVGYTTLQASQRVSHLLSNERNAGGPVGRALAALVDRSEYLVGTSNFPIDIIGNYKSYQYNFHEIDPALPLTSDLLRQKMMVTKA
ncbi:hypothetical protein B0H14DRAFT_3757657 [Mycena olivaceomarginata]|nr:hypothetical protein B0H14DRAFT_3757657 [Mycena olivaceomarginata]